MNRDLADDITLGKNADHLVAIHHRDASDSPLGQKRNGGAHAIAALHLYDFCALVLQDCRYGHDRILLFFFGRRSEEHTSELQSLMRISYAVFCLKKKKKTKQQLISE